MISVTVVAPKDCKGKKKLSRKDSVGVDMNVPPKASVSRKHVSEVLPIQGKYKKLITNEWIENQFVLLMEMNRLLVQLGRSRNLFAPREGWLSIIPTDPSDMNYAYQLLFVMICSSSLSDTSLLHHMKSIFDLLTVTPHRKLSRKLPMSWKRYFTKWVGPT